MTYSITSWHTYLYNMLQCFIIFIENLENHNRIIWDILMITQYDFSRLIFVSLFFDFICMIWFRSGEKLLRVCLSNLSMSLNLYKSKSHNIRCWLKGILMDYTQKCTKNLWLAKSALYLIYFLQTHMCYNFLEANHSHFLHVTSKHRTHITQS